jgi:hypothetical protein
MMNTINASTGFTGFQLQHGRSLRMLPLLVVTSTEDTGVVVDAAKIIHTVGEDVAQARDNLLLAKVTQAFHATVAGRTKDVFNVGDKVMLSTFHRRREYKKKGDVRAAKFFPRQDGPYVISDAHPETSNYTLLLPQSSRIYSVFHASQLTRFHHNDPILFPNRELMQPGPSAMVDGVDEFTIDKIIDSRRRGPGWQFLVRWIGYDAADNEWIPRRELEDCAALDEWFAEHPADNVPRYKKSMTKRVPGKR